MKALSLRPIAARWQIGSALLLFALAGQAFGQITGTVTGLPAGTLFSTLGPAVVVATNNDTNEVFTAAPSDTDGTYSIDPVDNGTYKVAVVIAGYTAPAVTNLVISDANPTATANFALVVPTPFPILKSATPIPLTEGIDSASFQNATEIDLNSGESIAVGTRSNWGVLGGPSYVSGRLKVMYSDLALHIAADVTYLTPDVNIQTGGNIWNGNAFEVDIQNDPYDPTRTAYNADHNWQFGLSLDANPEWYLWGKIQAHPSINGTDEPVTSHVMIQEKAAGTGETFRVDIPWAILLDSNKFPISAPADNQLGALDLGIDAAGNSQTRSDGFQLQWSGLPNSWQYPWNLVPVQYVNPGP